MQQEIISNHRTDDDGNPAGGHTGSTGLRIDWQEGPLGRGDERRDPNGCFVETVIAAAKDRIEFYEVCAEGRFSCGENQQAITLLSQALDVLHARTARREGEGVEGTHDP